MSCSILLSTNQTSKSLDQKSCSILIKKVISKKNIYKQKKYLKNQIINAQDQKLINYIKNQNYENQIKNLIFIEPSLKKDILQYSLQIQNKFYFKDVNTIKDLLIQILEIIRIYNLPFEYYFKVRQILINYLKINLNINKITFMVILNLGIKLISQTHILIKFEDQNLLNKIEAQVLLQIDYKIDQPNIWDFFCLYNENDDINIYKQCLPIMIYFTLQEIDQLDSQIAFNLASLFGKTSNNKKINNLQFMKKQIKLFQNKN